LTLGLELERLEKKIEIFLKKIIFLFFKILNILILKINLFLKNIILIYF